MPKILKIPRLQGKQVKGELIKISYRQGEQKCPKRRLLQKLVLRQRQELSHRLARQTVAFSSAKS